MLNIDHYFKEKYVLYTQITNCWLSCLLTTIKLIVMFRLCIVGAKMERKILVVLVWIRKVKIKRKL